MRVALVHDYLNQYGGGERVLGFLCEMFPRAHIFTLIYDERLTGGAFRGRQIHTSFLQKIPWAKKNHRFLPILMPLAVEQFDLSNFDLVISNSASFAKGVITKPYTKHISYCMTPTRYLWDDSQRHLQDFFGVKIFNRNKRLNARLAEAFGGARADIVSWFALPLLSYLRIWDQQASKRPDDFIAISEFVKQRIKKYYGRASLVVYPPVDSARFKISAEIADYFLMVGRLVSYKRFDLAIKVFNNLGWPLKIIGDGPERKRLQKLAVPNADIEFLGLVSDYKLPSYYSRARALIFPQEEDFGIVVVESMASGRPVVAFRGGGSLETIKEGETGVFFGEQTEESLTAVLREFNPFDFDSQKIKARATLFDKGIFREKFSAILNI
ncbi:MAG: glycosyltransferase [Candidatus Yanofskybacteria bacterium]|nr:glycosyltransferase [Candidatus Yanofskybacteria bacterium]